MTDTPRTDAAVFTIIGAGYNSVCPNFARQLERELTTVKEAYRRQLRQITELSSIINTLTATDTNTSTPATT